METANRTLTTDVIAALTYWPGIIWVGQKNPPDPVDVTVLPPFFNELLQELPWWNRDWRISDVEPGRPLEINSDHHGLPAAFTEVSVPGTAGSGSGETLPFVAKVGFAGDRLIRFQAKIGEVVLGPAAGPAGQLEPHPFARVLTGLMELRGIPVQEMAVETARSPSTIHMLRNGKLNPKPLLAREIAKVLGMSEADMRVVAGLDDGSPQ
ncbi:helix-turn-helix domain-containing protein [Kitasatospora purpeofusca]|uniref:helix-turn-helix domain-containing protein n=1 Tax=Kitasatospora purpeofusca TaxID=67352 RepID=UPI000A647272|nr:helix-turn-helix transcriptional regulator [Kitasatospora purpeofusca]MCX4756650.1 helix-turn-helix transcriptional regulator [Kitasatospora purpeofusca]WSR35554.1 helix-turn-helix transcriptional regulator [Kitasatospora purpeofusca]